MYIYIYSGGSDLEALYRKSLGTCIKYEGSGLKDLAVDPPDLKFQNP